MNLTQNERESQTNPTALKLNYNAYLINECMTTTQTEKVDKLASEKRSRVCIRQTTGIGRFFFSSS